MRQHRDKRGKKKNAKQKTDINLEKKLTQPKNMMSLMKI